MVNSKDILARLQNGETAESIANELINALNDANDTYNKEVAAKKAESEARAKREANKVADMQDILDLLHDFCIEYYCDSNEDINEVHAAFNELTAEKVIEIVEEAGAAVLELDNQLDKWLNTFSFGKLTKPTVELRVGKDATPADADAVIDKFLKSIGLK